MMATAQLDDGSGQSSRIDQPYMIVFLVGMPRSGTKLLRDLLNRHTDIALFPNESHFIPYFYRRYGTRSDLSDARNFGRVFREFRTTAFCRRLEMRGITFAEEDWRSHLSSGGFADVLRALFSCYRAQSGAWIVGDKTPEYITQVPLLTKLLPEARFVHIVRDPRDYALSMRKAWGKSIPRAIFRWKLHVGKYSNDVARESVTQITVRYEDLVKSPENTMRQVCQFLGVHFQPQMTSLDVVSEELGDAKGLNTVLAANTQKWNSQLTKKDIQMIEAIAGTMMAKFGYHSTTVPGDANIAWLSGLRYRAADAANLLRFRYRMEGSIWGALRESWRAFRHSGLDE